MEIDKRLLRNHIPAIPFVKHICYIHGSDGHEVAYRGNTFGSISNPHPTKEFMVRENKIRSNKFTFHAIEANWYP